MGGPKFNHQSTNGSWLNIDGLEHTRSKAPKSVHISRATGHDRNLVVESGASWYLRELLVLYPPVIKRSWLENPL